MALPWIPGEGVDDLVLQDGKEPGAEGRIAAEALEAFERRKQRLLHRVFGMLAVAETPHGEAQQLRTKASERIDARRQGRRNFQSLLASVA